MIKISIITVVLNNKLLIERAIRSVIDQNYDNIEYIIIDGGSTDGTLDVIRKYEQNIFFWISEKDKGLYDAMNKGVQIATGELIGIVNSDDWLEIDVVEKIVNAYLENKDYSIFHGNINSIIANKKYLRVPRKINKFNLYFRRMPVWHPSCFMHNRIYDEFKYNLKRPIAADLELIWEAWEAGYKFYYIDIVISNHQSGGTSYNTKRLFIDSLRLRAKMDKNYFKLMLYFLIFWAGLLKKIIREIYEK